jgi:hypothetical protein
MAVVAHPSVISPPASAASTAPAGPVAPASPGFDPEPTINAAETSLADYLNLPVHDILARLGLSPVPGGTAGPGPSGSATD